MRGDGVEHSYAVLTAKGKKVMKESEIEQSVKAFDTESKGSLSEREWRKLCAAFPELINIQFAGSFVPVVDWVTRRNVAASQAAPTTCAAPPQTSVPQVVGSPRREPPSQVGARSPPSSGPSSGVARVVAVAESFISGGVAGAISKTVIAPGDRVKIIYQVDPNRKFSLPSALKTGKKIVQHGGILGLWCGNGATMMRVVPYASVTYATFDRYRMIFNYLLLHHSDCRRTDNPQLSVLSRFVSGALAGATATACTYPLDMMRARFAAHWDGKNPRYPSYYAAFQEITAVEGWRALYNGLRPTLVGIMPYVGTSFCCFETFKHYLIVFQHLNNDREIPMSQRLVAGGLAGLIGQSSTYPLDIVRRRMQVTPHKYKSLLHALSEISKTEGIKKGLYKGLSMNWIKGPIAVATSFTVNDHVKLRIRNYHATAVAEEPASKRRFTCVERMICGGIAGGVSKTWTAPLDRLKIIYVVGLCSADEHNYHASAYQTMRNMLRDTPHMWQGSGAMVMRVVPYAALVYTAFEPCQTLVKRLLFEHESSFITNLLAGMVAGSVSTAFLYPIDLMRARNAMHTSGKLYQSYSQGLRDIWRRQGARGLFDGLRPTVVGIAPMTGIAFALYNYLTEKWACEGFAGRLLAGAAAGIASQVATYPLNVVRRRAQVEDVAYRSISCSLRLLYAQDGFYSGLYRRMPMGWTLGALTVGLSFSVNDWCRDGLLYFRNLVYHDSSLISIDSESNGNGLH